MLKANRAQGILTHFLTQQPEANTELKWSSPFGLLVAVVLSAQCTDQRVNMLTPPLLTEYPNAKAMAAAGAEEVYPFIASCTYPRQKARHLVAMAQLLVEKHNGEVPDDFDALVALPGVGRKTANVMLAVAFGHSALAVDTHVHRVSARLGLTRGAKSVEDTERQLKALFNREYWSRLHHWLILHGRYVCKARRPLCGECQLQEWCAAYPRLARER